MELNEGLRLKKTWHENGNPSCSHPDLEKETFNGSKTGDLVCTTCGDSGPMPDGPDPK